MMISGPRRIEVRRQEVEKFELISMAASESTSKGQRGENFKGRWHAAHKERRRRNARDKIIFQSDQDRVFIQSRDQ